MVADVVALLASGWVLARLGLPVGRWLLIVPRVALAAAPALAIWFVPVPALAKVAIALPIYAVLLVVVRAVPDELYIELRRLRGTAA
jgi:hypothetical protein